jgi:hypothetical protein
MANFFNRQEEVIDLELTPWGKRMFAEGRLKPKYYAFYDDDILYDQDYQPSGSIQKTLNTAEAASGGKRRGYTLEKQNDVVTRIKETPRLNIYSADGYTKVGNGYERSGDAGNAPLVNITRPTPNYATVASIKFLRPLGKNNPNEIYAPAWQIKAVSGSEPLTMSGTEGEPYQSGASGSAILVPFFSASLPLQYDKETIRLSIDPQTNRVVSPGPGVRTSNIETFDLARNSRLLLDVQEINTILKGNGNFDIEVFMATKQPRQNVLKEQKQLFFSRPDSHNAGNGDISNTPDSEYVLPELEDDSIVNNLAGGDMIITRAFPRFEINSVERYLSVRVDDEIVGLEGLGEPGETLYRTTVVSDPVDPCEDV